MKNIAVVYHSKYGSTKRYAQWLAQTLGADLFESKQCRLQDLERHDVIIYAGNVFASSISGISLLKKNGEKLKDKQVIALAVGASPDDSANLATLRKHNFDGTWLSDVPVFYAQGALDITRMGFVDRTLCNMIKKSVAKKDPATLDPQQREFIEVLTVPSDWTDEKHLVPLIEHVRSIL